MKFSFSLSVFNRYQFRDSVYHGISYPSLHFLGIHPTLLGERVFQDNTNDKWNIPWYTTRGRCITVLYHAIEMHWQRNQCDVCALHDGKVDAIPSNIQRVSCIPIGCIFYGRYSATLLMLQLCKVVLKSADNKRRDEE